ncbi:MAG: acyltransferase [Chitinophagaceae bacterium]|nr:acyltransferase [Chitinophagaceae bacterium]MCA6459681.1 acyltransferase [Chitinophagaceae bacterium]MCA6464548.1 acyltransferase [Chitinophagaceae bacterium]
MKKLILNFLLLFKPFIRRLANVYDIRLNYPITGSGSFQIEIDDFEVSSKLIPKTVYFNTRSGKIKIGRNTVFGEDVMLLTGKHLSIDEVDSSENLHHVPEGGRDILIGSNCYIGSGAILIGPLQVGDYSVICAGAVVTKDIPAYTMVGGVPAKKIKDLQKRFANA